MISTLVAFGDSFVFGQGLRYPKIDSLPSCVAKNLNLDVINCAKVGASLIDTADQLRHWLGNQNNDISRCLFLVGLTDGSRETLYLHHGTRARPIPHYIHDPDTFEERVPELKWTRPFVEMYLKMSDLSYVGDLRYWLVTSLFENLCMAKNIPLLMFNCWPPYGKFNLDSLSTAPQLTGWAQEPQNRSLLLDDGHLNREGNRIYAEFLTKDIIARKLLE